MKWSMVTLREVAPSVASSHRFSADAIIWNLSLDQIESDTGNILNKSYKPASGAGISTFVFDENNVLYSKLRPYLNKVVRPNETGLATTELIPLRPKQKLLEPDYLVYYLRSPLFVQFASHNVSGTKMPRVIMDAFWDHQLPLPPLSEQRRIVEILDQADQLRKLRVEADKKAERILLALFNKMFGDPATNPKMLTKKPIGEAIRVRSGNFLPAKNMAVEGVYPVYGGNGINGYHSEFMFKERTIVIGRVGAYCGVVHYSEPNCWVTDNALYVTEKHKPIEDEYLAFALHHANLNRYAGQAGQPLISASRIYPVEILVPDEEEQRVFSRAYRDLEKHAGDRAKSKQELENIFSLLMQRAFSGTLTASWREAHMKELLAEMEQQAKYLN